MGGRDGSTVLGIAPGLRFLGEYQDSGFSRERYLVARGDGQILQLTRLLYLTLRAIDEAEPGAIAERVGAQYGRRLSADNIDYLVTAKLRPLGLVITDAPDDRAPQEIPTTNLLLGVKCRRELFPATVSGRIARVLAVLHHPAAVGVLLAAFVAFDMWLFGVYGATHALVDLLNQPTWILAALGLSLLAMIFHEFGHASACHYSGARPGAIGFGIYLIWPAAYTDVTDIYRANRAGRLRTDLGGIYFNAIFVLAMGACYGFTGQPVFLAVAVVTHLDALQQLVPIFRMDGYFILGDLAGIPDMFGKVKPILASALPGRGVDPRVRGLRRSSRIIVTAWVATVIPVIALGLGYMLWNLPRIVPVGTHTFMTSWHAAAAAFAAADILTGLVNVVNIGLLLIPLVGIGYLLSRPAVKLGRLLTPRRR